MGVKPKDKKPFGGGNLTEFFSPDDPWEALYEISDRLCAGEPIDSGHAYWLFEAIDKSQRDPKELLRRLDLRQGKGRPHTPFEAWLPWAQRLVELEDEGKAPEAALSQVMKERGDANQEKDRTTLQRWRNEYRKARDIARDD